MYSTPNLASLSRCSTRMAPTFGSESSLMSFALGPFSPKAISWTTALTRKDFAAAKSLSRSTCRAMSPLWSCEEARA